MELPRITRETRVSFTERLLSPFLRKCNFATRRAANVCRTRAKKYTRLMRNLSERERERAIGIPLDLVDIFKSIIAREQRVLSTVTGSPLVDNRALLYRVALFEAGKSKPAKLPRDFTGLETLLEKLTS